MFVGEIHLKLGRRLRQRVGKFAGDKFAAALEYANRLARTRQARGGNTTAVTGADHDDLIVGLQLRER
jgi:hypothetical protein